MFTIVHRDYYTKIIVHGRLTHKDYIETLIPEINKLSELGGRKLMINALEFSGMQPRAVLDDLKLGITKRKKIAKLAIVTHKSWMIFLVDLIKQIVASEIKTYENEQDASDWLMQD